MRTARARTEIRIGSEQTAEVSRESILPIQEHSRNLGLMI